MTPAGIITTVAGADYTNGAPDSGHAATVPIGYITALTVVPAGQLYMRDQSFYIVRMLSGGMVSTVAGSGVPGYSGGGGPATSATFQPPGGLAVDAAGDLYIADPGSNVIRKVDTSGIITTYAGTDGRVTPETAGRPLQRSYTTLSELPCPQRGTCSSQTPSTR